MPELVVGIERGVHAVGVLVAETRDVGVGRQPASNHFKRDAVHPVGVCRVRDQFDRVTERRDLALFPTEGQSVARRTAHDADWFLSRPLRS